MFRQQAITDPERPARQPPVERALLFVTALYALLPFGRWALTGVANQVDLGVATILFILVLGSLFEKRRRPAASAPEEEP